MHWDSPINDFYIFSYHRGMDWDTKINDKTGVTVRALIEELYYKVNVYFFDKCNLMLYSERFISTYHLAIKVYVFDHTCVCMCMLVSVLVFPVINTNDNLSKYLIEIKRNICTYSKSNDNDEHVMLHIILYCIVA